MTVKELIEELQKMPQDKRVIIFGGSLVDIVCVKEGTQGAFQRGVPPEEVVVIV
jgi:hypothetical protein